jgi:hypothetical protein
MPAEEEQMSTDQRQAIDAGVWRWVIVAAIVAIAFFASYRLATAGEGGSAASGERYVSETVGAGGGVSSASSAGSASGGCACCGTTSSEPVEGFTTDAGGVQTLDVDVTSGFAPNVIRAKAGIPVEITFGQGSGCMAEVMSADLGFYEDLQSGPKTIALPGLEPGEYGFSCGMEMVFGVIVVE